MFGFGKKSKSTQPKSDWTDAIEIADENHKIANSALRIAKETKEIGIKTINTLEDQESQIDSLNDHLAEIELHANETSKTISRIHSLPRSILHGLGSFFSCCRSTPEENLEHEKAKNRKAGSHPKKKKKKSPETNEDTLPTVVYLPSWQRPTNRPLSDEEERFAAANDRNDQTVHEIHSVVHDLKDQAIQIGDQLDRRNAKLDKAKDRAEKGKKKMSRNNKKMRA